MAAVTDIPDTNGLFTVVVELVKLGAIGLAGFIFLGILLVLLQGRSADAATARLRQSYLKYGTFCAIAFAVLSLAQGYFSSSHNVSLTFSPDFDENLLPQPKITLLDKTVRPSEPFAVDRDMQIVIGVEAALNRARQLASNVDQLKATTNELIKQSATFDTKIAAAIRTAPNSVALVDLNNSVRAAGPAKTDLVRALEANRFEDVSRISKSISRGLGLQ